MIEVFKCPETEKIFNGFKSLKLPHEIQKVARRKLRMINAAININDLRSPPNNHLEQLSGDRKGQHSIRINNQYRIYFIWKENNAYNLEIVDYH